MFEPAQLRTFLAVAQTLSFTRAAHRLGLRQSTVSQHVRRLEEAAGCRLFLRDTHAVELTEDGEAMLRLARPILEANERAAAYFTGTRLRGRLRVGVAEEIVPTRLPEILAAFRHDHPEVDLELAVELSGALHQRLDAGGLDLCLAERSGADGPGRLVWRDKLVWVGADRLRLDPRRPVPLIGHPAPGPGRARAAEVLERHGRAWRPAGTSASLGGLVAAARAGLGVMAHPQGLIPAGLVRVQARAYGLPDLGSVDFVLRQGRPGGPVEEAAADALAEAILAGGGLLHRPLALTGP